MKRAHKSSLIAVLVGVPLGVAWLWIGTLVFGPRWLNLWGWFSFAILIAVFAYSEHKRNARRAIAPDYLLQGSDGVVVHALRPEGQIRVGSELWSARARNATNLEVGTQVRVCGRDGLFLVVEKQEIG